MLGGSVRPPVPRAVCQYFFRSILQAYEARAFLSSRDCARTKWTPIRTPMPDMLLAPGVRNSLREDHLGPLLQQNGIVHKDLDHLTTTIICGDAQSRAR